MATTTTGAGYWIAAGNGGVSPFGDAVFYGGADAAPLARPIVAIAATPTGKGYRMVASDGGVFVFGDASFLGSTGAVALARPVVGID
jgi:hypothetical protein